MREDGFMKHIFIINPVAGNGIDNVTYSEKIKQAFTELGIEDYEIYVTTGVGNANEFAKEKVATGEHIRFYACGGDGKLSEVVNGSSSSNWIVKVFFILPIKQ